MSLKTSVGYAEGEDAYVAGTNACQEAFEKLGTDKADLAIVFSSVKYDQEKMLAGVRSIIKDTLIVGASTAGEITSDGALGRQSVAIMLFTSDTIRFYTGIGPDLTTDARAAGKAAADSVKQQAGDSLKLVIMFPDILAGNGADIVRGVADSLGSHFPIVGGASGDDFRFEKTYQYFNGEVKSRSVVCLGLAGDFKFAIGVKHGWIPIGNPYTVTKSEGSVLHELDGKPAVSIYEEYFGEEEAKQLRSDTLAKLAVTYPLGMNIPGSDEMLIRDPLTVDANGSITCAAEVPEGSHIQLMIGNREEAVQAAKYAADSARAQLGGAKPQAIIIFNCVARRKLFGESASDEIHAMHETLGADVPLIGFYTYGEQAPLGGEVRNFDKCDPTFFNGTVVICALAN